MNSDALARARRLEAFAQRDAGNAVLLRDLARAYHQAGEHGQALQALDRASACAVPGDAGDGALRGQLLLALGRWDDAARLYEAALAGEPESPALLFNAGYALWAAGTAPERAYALLARAAAARPDDTHVLLHAALAADAAGERDAARSTLAHLLAIEPRHARALSLLARLLLEDGDTDGAAELADRCVAAQPGGAAGWQLKGEIALFRFDAAQAVRCLQQARDLDPQDLDTKVSLAQAAVMQGRLKHARQLLDAVLAQDAAHGQALALLGWVHLADEAPAEARAAFAAAAAADPAAAEPQAGLACLALAENDAAAARQHCAAALSAEPGHPLAQLVSARIDELQGATPERSQAALRDLLAQTTFGAAAPSFGSMVAQAGQSPAVRRLQRRLSAAASHSSKHTQQGATPS